MQLSVRFEIFGCVLKHLPPLSTDVFQDAISRGVRNISFGDLLGDLGKTM